MHSTGVFFHAHTAGRVKTAKGICWLQLVFPNGDGEGGKKAVAPGSLGQAPRSREQLLPLCPLVTHCWELPHVLRHHHHPNLPALVAGSGDFPTSALIP